MSAIELFNASGKPAGVFHCSDCKIVYRTEKDATECYCQPKICQCGEPAQSRYQSLCRECDRKRMEEMELAKFEKAEKIEDWLGPVFIDGLGHNEGYFDGIDELLDFLKDTDDDEDSIPWPKYAWICDSHPTFYADLDSLANSDDVPENQDFEDCEGISELQAACDKFNELNKGIETWTPNDHKCVLIPEKSESANSPCQI